jgi:hypothetical protein
MILLPTVISDPNRDEITERDPLGEFLVWWKDFSQDDVEKFARRLSTATREEDIQKFLSKKPMLLARLLGGGHGRWVIPKQKLGSQYVTDFIIGERSSIGFEWYAVELEGPLAKMYTKAGDPTCKLTHAIRQIQDWRAWIQRNQNYAARNRSENGLGLTDIVSAVPGLILMGRRSDVSAGTSERRRQMVLDLNIKIHSYDWLLESERGLINA